MDLYQNQQPYNPDAGPWPLQFSEEEIEGQRNAGREVLQRFQEAMAEEGTCKHFEIEPGVYRLAAPFVVDHVEDLEIVAADVELIIEGEERNAHFRVLCSKDIKFKGPLTLDSSPFGFTQGTIMESDLHLEGQCSALTVNIHEGYTFPVKGFRITCFDPQTGVMLPRYQHIVNEVQDLGDGRALLTFDEAFLKHYRPETERAVAVGNLICLEQGDNIKGGFELRETTNIIFEDINMFTYCLIWGLPCYGDYEFTRVRGGRRPGSNRLMGGGFPAVSVLGGSCTFQDCEWGHNFDDLTDIGAELNFAWGQVAPNQVYIARKEGAVTPGMHFAFYGAYTNEPTGEATVVEAALNQDEGVTRQFWEALGKAQILTWDCVPYLVTLDRDVSISELEIADSRQARIKKLTFVRCYLHDSLAAGISLKGADETVIEHNVIERAGYRAIGVGFDPYWWEGGIPRNITIRNNYILDTPFNLPDLTPAINIYIDAAEALLEKATGTPMHNVHISDNTIVNCKTAAIGVQYCKHARVENNSIQNPMAAGLQTAWGKAKNYDNPSAILCNAVADVTVAGNRITLADPQLVPEVVRATSKTQKGEIRLLNNTVTVPGGHEEALPESFFHKAGACHENTEFSGQWEARDFEGCFSNRFHESRCPGSTATFKWNGTRGRIFGILWTSLGPVDVHLDGELVTTVDCGALPVRFKDFIGDEALLDQLLFDSGPLEDEEHSLAVVVKEQYAPDTGCGAGIEAFEYLKGHHSCHSEGIIGSHDSHQNFFQKQFGRMQDKFSEL